MLSVPSVATTGPGAAKAVAAAVVITVTAVAILIPLSRMSAPPPFVARLSFVNPTEYHLDIEVTDAQREGWLAVGTAQKNQSTTMEDTTDQGDV